jgi:hypothetical protein
MPLLDHFRPPIKNRLPWETLHTAMCAALAVRLNKIAPPRFVALETVRRGGAVEIDVGSFEEDRHPAEGANGPAVGVLPAGWTPPPRTAVMEADFPDTFEVKVYDREFDGGKLVGAIELVSERNKDRDTARAAFAAKCASYLASGVCLVVLDVVTTRRTNMHDEIMRVMGAPDEFRMPADTDLYAVTYRPVIRDDRPDIDLWFRSFSLGDSIPTMPLRLVADLFLPVEFDPVYTEACRERRLY